MLPLFYIALNPKLFTNTSLQPESNLKEATRNDSKIPWQTTLLEPDYNEDATQPAFTCSKLTIETLEQGVKYVGVVLVSLL